MSNGFREFSLKEVLEAAERASRRVASWPEWKRKLSTVPKVPEKETKVALDRDPDYVNAEGETLELSETYEDEYGKEQIRYMDLATSGVGEGLLVELEDSGKYMNYYLSAEDVDKLRELIGFGTIKEPPGLVEPPMMDFE